MTRILGPSSRSTAARLGTITAVAIALAVPVSAPPAAASSWESSAPMRTLALAATPYGIALAPDGRMSLTTWDGKAGQLARFAAGWSKSSAPEATLTPGGDGQLLGVAVAPGGVTYVAGYRTTPYNKQLQSYAPGWAAGAAPTASTSGLFDPALMALDASGAVSITVWNSYRQGGSEPDKIVTYAAGFANGAAPIRTLAGSSTQLSGPGGVAFDSSGRMYVTNSLNADRVTVYAAGATGNAAPTAVIEGSNTGLKGPVGIAVDSTGRIYVANNGADSVAVFAPGATGNVAPIATLKGGGTGLSGPYGLALDSAGQVYVTNATAKTVTVYPAFGKSAKVTITCVKGKKKVKVTGINPKCPRGYTRR